MTTTTGNDGSHEGFTVSVRVALWLLAFLLIINAVMGGLLVVTRAAQKDTDANYQHLVVCQVHHNKLTADALSARDTATKAATKTERNLWRGVQHALRHNELTGHTLEDLITTYLTGLRQLQATRYANPYPPGGLCDQLERKAKNQ